MGKISKYRYFNGEEFALDIITKTKKDALEAIEYWKKQFKRFNINFPFKYRIIKTKQGYAVYVNNTVRNMNYWEQYGKIPKEKR